MKRKRMEMRRRRGRGEGKVRKEPEREESEKRERTNFNTVVQLTSCTPNEFIEKLMKCLYVNDSYTNIYLSITYHPKSLKC